MSNQLIQNRLNIAINNPKKGKADELENNIEHYVKNFHMPYHLFKSEFIDNKGREYSVAKGKGSGKFIFDPETASESDIPVFWGDRILFMRNKKKYRKEYGWPNRGDSINASSENFTVTGKIDSIFFEPNSATGHCVVKDLFTYKKKKKNKKKFSFID